MKVIKNVSQGKAEIQDVDVPKLESDYLLIKVKNVALNPTDWYIIFQMSQSLSETRLI